LNFETLVADSINRLSSLKRYLTYNGDTMDTTQPTSQIVNTYEKVIFPTSIRCYEYGLTQELIDSLFELVSTKPTEDIMTLEHPSVDKFKEIIYDICQELAEFKADTNETRNEPIPLNEKLNYLPQITGSNILFQQPKEHIPLHAYEYIPLVFTFVLNTGEYPQFTYFADTRGAVQTIRQKVSQNLVGTSFGLRGKVGEVIITPGYLQRYTETNLSDQAQVFFNVMVGFASY
jgi:hypothetical protein